MNVHFVIAAPHVSVPIRKCGLISALPVAKRKRKKGEKRKKRREKRERKEKRKKRRGKKKEIIIFLP